MIRSLSRRLRRTLSFRGRSKYRNKEKGSKNGATSNSNWEQDAITIKQNGGISFTVKYLGCLEVSESRGTQVCSQAAHQMKVSSAGKKKQRVTLRVTEDTLQVTDDETKSLVVDQVIEKVSFCTPDPHDEKLFSYICRDGTSRRWLCHSFKGIKDTGERISHAVGCAFAACLAKKQQQNQSNQNLQRGSSTRKTLESRPNGVKLPQQSVDTLQKLNENEYTDRVEKVNNEFNATPSQVSSTDAKGAVQNTAALVNKPPQTNEFAARPRPSGSGSDIGGLTRHTSLPYRTKKSAGSSTYQALTEDPLPPRLPTTPPATSPATSPTSEEAFWLTNTNNGLSNTTVTVTATQPNPFSPQHQQQQPILVQQQAGFTQTFQTTSTEQQSPNPFSANGNPFGLFLINHFNPTDILLTVRGYRVDMIFLENDASFCEDAVKNAKAKDRLFKVKIDEKEDKLN